MVPHLTIERLFSLIRGELCPFCAWDLVGGLIRAVTQEWHGWATKRSRRFDTAFSFCGLEGFIRFGSDRQGEDRVLGLLGPRWMYLVVGFLDSPLVLCPLSHLSCLRGSKMGASFTHSEGGADIAEKSNGGGNNTSDCSGLGALSVSFETGGTFYVS
jgi:hypothetical protein